MVENIYFIGDPYRGEQDLNIEKLKNLFSPLLEQLGIRHQTFITDINKSKDRSSWIKIWSDSLMEYPSPASSCLDLTNSAIIGFEAPDGELNYLSRQGAKWINFSLHPIRFMDDLRFEVRSSFKFDRSRVSSPHAAIKFAANQLKNGYRVGGGKKNTLLICGQDWIDRSIYFDGEFKHLDSYLSKIDLLASQNERVLFRPHPSSLNNEVCELICKRYSAEISKKSDFYEVLSTENISTLCAISSSVVTEGPFFDVESVFLESRAQRYGAPIDYRLLLNDAEFWLRGFFGEEKSDSLFQISNYFPDNILRKTFGAWSFVSDEVRNEVRIQSLNLSIIKVQEQAMLAEAKAQEAEATAREAELKAKETEVIAKQAELKAKETEVIAKQAELKAKETEVIAKQAELKAKETEVIAKQAELKAKETEVIAKQAELKAKETEVIAKQAELQAQQAESMAQRAEIKAHQVEDELLDQTAKLKAVYLSTSWRMTAPLRQAGRTVRAIAQLPKDLKFGLKVKTKLLLTHASLFVNRRPKLRHAVKYVLARFPNLKARLVLATTNRLHEQTIETTVSTDLKNLTPRALKIYMELKAAIERQQKELT